MKRPFPTSRAFPLPASLLLGLTLAFGPARAAEPAKVIPVGTKPESVTKGFDGHYFVTVMNDGKNPGDGAVKRVAGDKVEDFATGLDDPKGIVFTGGHLVTADLKRLWKIDASGQKTVLAEEKDFPHPIGMLNDVAALPGGDAVYVSDMGANKLMRDPEGKLWPLDSPEAKALPAIGRIYKVTLDGKVSLVVDANPGMPCPNGVGAPSADELLIGEFFTGALLSVKGGQTTVLATGYRGADAIERDKEGNLYVSSWVQGKVWKLDPQGQNARVISEGYQSAADFHLDHEAKVLILPDMLAGTLTFLPLE